MRNYQFAIVFFILLINNNIFSQGYPKYEVKSGVGLEQGFNFGLNRYYSKNFNAGLGIGSHFPPASHTHHFVFFVENNCHLKLLNKKKADLTGLFNQQIMYWRYSQPDFTHQATTFALNLGIRITFPNDFGFIFEIGPTITYTLKFVKDVSSNVEPITKVVQPNFRLLFFKRF
jgi:hypothetical protein